MREEKTLFANVRAGSRDRTSALAGKQIKAAIATFPQIDFTGPHGRAQHNMIEQLGTGGRISVAIGVAGSGKSTLLKPLVRAWQDDGRIVHGLALAWRQSDDLTEAGIAARYTRAVDSFLFASKSGRLSLDRKSVVVVDEIGLLGTRQLNEILAAQKRDGFQLVMLGDPKQMQSVEAGSVIELLRRALGAGKIPLLGSSVRQKDVEERETVLMFRDGQTEEAVRRKDANGTLRIVPGGYQEAVTYVAELWEERRHANRDRTGFTISVSAPTNSHAHDISVAIRERRKKLGEIGPDKIALSATDTEGLHAYDLALAPGDRIRLFKRTNAKFIGTSTTGNIGRNGTVLEITDARNEGLMLRNPAGKEGFVSWTSLKDERSGRILLAYGDALTTNTAQGTTVTEHIHAIPAGSRLVSAFGAYTSGSRHRERSFIATSEGAERAEIVARRPVGDRREIMRGDVLNNVIRNFSRQPQKEAALEMLDRATAIRRGTIQMVQSSLRSAESRAAAQQAPTILNERFASRRVGQTLEERLSGLVQHLHRHQATIAQAAQTAATFVERLATITRRRTRTPKSQPGYWQKAQRDGEKSASTPELTDKLEQNRKRAVRR